MGDKKNELKVGRSQNGDYIRVTFNDALATQELGIENDSTSL